MSETAHQPTMARRPLKSVQSSELRRLQAQVQELLRLCRAQEQRLSELEQAVSLQKYGWSNQLDLGIDL